MCDSLVERILILVGTISIDLPFVFFISGLGGSRDGDTEAEADELGDTLADALDDAEAEGDSDLLAEAEGLNDALVLALGD